jgi:glycosyltransferase involved in cell wall biosynthesis
VRLVFVTQQVDPSDPILAATVPKLRAVAALVDELVVLADRSVPDVLPGNCRVLHFGAATRAGRGARFTAALTRELARRPRPAGVVAHMCPIYAVLAAPLARPVGVPVVLWFNHWKRSRTLELAERLSTSVVSVEPRSFPIPSRKVRSIGHGIDLAEFECAPPAPDSDGLRALALGRYSPAKGLETLLRGVRVARDRGLDVKLELHGAAPTEETRVHRAELEGRARELGLEDAVAIGGSVPRSEVPGLLARSDVLVNNMREGALDKVVYEAAAACRPAVASNEGFDALLDGAGAELRFDRTRPESLAERLAALAALPPDERARIGRTLRQRVLEGHSVEAWARKLLEVVTA